jgi:hypothetical protein
VSFPISIERRASSNRLLHLAQPSHVIRAAPLCLRSPRESRSSEHTPPHADVAPSRTPFIPTLDPCRRCPVSEPPSRPPPLHPTCPLTAERTEGSEREQEIESYIDKERQVNREKGEELRRKKRKERGKRKKEKIRK